MYNLQQHIDCLSGCAFACEQRDCASEETNKQIGDLKYSMCKKMISLPLQQPWHPLQCGRTSLFAPAFLSCLNLPKQVLNCCVALWWVPSVCNPMVTIFLLTFLPPYAIWISSESGTCIRFCMGNGVERRQVWSSNQPLHSEWGMLEILSDNMLVLCFRGLSCYKHAKLQFLHLPTQDSSWTSWSRGPKWNPGYL